MYRSGMHLVPTRIIPCKVKGIAVRGHVCSAQRGVVQGAPGPSSLQPQAFYGRGLFQFSCSAVPAQLCIFQLVLALPYLTALKCRSMLAQLRGRSKISVSHCRPQGHTFLFDATPAWNPSSLAVLHLRAECGASHEQLLPLFSLSAQ